MDEVGELPLTTQVRLLRVLENGEFIKVGSSSVQKTNVRIVAATNVNMFEAIEKGKKMKTYKIGKYVPAQFVWGRWSEASVWWTYRGGASSRVPFV